MTITLVEVLVVAGSEMSRDLWQYRVGRGGRSG